MQGNEGNPYGDDGRENLPKHGWMVDCGKARAEKLAKEMGSINVQPGNSGCSGATIFPTKMLLTLQCTTDICARIK